MANESGQSIRHVLGTARRSSARAEPSNANSAQAPARAESGVPSCRHGTVQPGTLIFFLNWPFIAIVGFFFCIKTPTAIKLTVGVFFKIKFAN